MKSEEIPVLQLPAEASKTQKAAIMDMNNKRWCLEMEHRLQTPAMQHVEPKGAPFPPGLEGPWAVQEDRIQVSLHNSKNQEQNQADN